MKYSRMTEEELFEVLKSIAQTLKDEAKFIEELAAGKFLPKDSLARKQTIQSHKKLMDKLRTDANDMYDDLLRRWKK